MSSISSFEGRGTPEPDNPWDPGGLPNSSNRNCPNACVLRAINSALVCSTNDEMEGNDAGSRTELDSHANMVVVGKHCHIIDWTGGKADVNPFTPEYEALREVPIVDAAILYECPYSGRENLLIVRNALYVPAMENNLIPPFIMREAGLHVHDVPKIQVTEPTIEDHSISLPSEDLRIPLSLWGIFSYFPMYKPSREQMEECENVYLLTPNGQWNPHTDVYAKNEENILDWEGNIVEPKNRPKIILSEVQDDEAMTAVTMVSSVESQAVDDNIGHIEPVPWPVQAPDSSGIEVSPIYDQEVLMAKLIDRAQDGAFMTSIGSTNVCESRYLDDEPPLFEVETVDEFDEEDDISQTSDDFSGQLDFDDIMSSAAHARIK